MMRMPIGQLDNERARIQRRLATLPVPAELRTDAARLLEQRLRKWSCIDAAPLTRYADGSPQGTPVVLSTDPVELWMLRAIAPTSNPARFKLSANGAVYVEEYLCGYKVYVTGISSLLDEVTDVCRNLYRRSTSEFVELHGQFIAGPAGVDGEPFLRVEFNPPNPPSGKSFLQRLVSLLPWVHDDPPRINVAETESDDPILGVDDAINARPVHNLIVRFDAGQWPPSGVLKELGYKVGKSGLGPDARRQILTKAYRVSLVAGSEDVDPYLREWGLPQSRERASKIERCLGGFAYSARKKDADMSEAIADWEADLEWFRQNLKEWS
jgi:hypothetical protein